MRRVASASRREPAMTKRCVVWAGVAVAGLLLGGAALLLRVAWDDTVTVENCGRVAKGMTLAEVEAVFGRSADWGPSQLVLSRRESGGQTRVEELFTGRIWVGRECRAYVAFDDDDRVIWLGHSMFEPQPLHRKL